MADHVTALIVAAGQGTRSGPGQPKQYRRIAGKAVLAHAIDALANHPAIHAVQVVIAPGQEDVYRAAIGERRLPPPVIGGETRRESVANGLRAIGGGRVLIHDAARPFVPADVVDRLLAALDGHDGAVPVLPVVDTIVRVADSLGDVVPRDPLRRVQTPQAFRHDAIRAAHAAWPEGREATDDAQMLRAIGRNVAIVEGAAMLEKLTFPSDFEAAERRLADRLVSRTALGFDVHGFAPGNSLWLGGIEIPHTRGLAGHSDADVALHALTDALLGTIGAGDIGTHFPPSDPQWRGAASWRFLDHARKLVEDAGGRIDHVDLTIICEEPKVGPYRPAIRTRIAEILGIGEGKVSVKATTTERLGFTGRREGIAAQAAATVRVPDGDEA
ncbi:bifunctional 2-C-methyl-D-erythritol 4-phosphate cytidylyltransferase/2-C-methyl-D-erythritol 2,4-cyclodiphosphate synthase [Sphingomonas sp.]|uniref:bifunctional 2-C-methyl-D-erythritol 4-phosphate cytidylyltransferase/2-C-methyl-D-erythritol 2,4-cyclodiphosphate synthase n=1 Tax=Sphingomonas sp. TaxID=28214 RepID=UPI000DB5E91F|nr:bifunctional 2-C-methyl-D-erythritol 4-phosphate cytidylyltransferase/2-C-methyl-D-erythritol 2,4-cyclodiphosphate synthase [Sphingomonas sp.]PZU08550.1 MAG: bifunctional 2-C-methyl-D-erythritol 4-phosphate cytidylyltransferase/2-C-methyl-D-erythritol 2,4-cyclodiphosphate synthase [Sphingomonas sp.]